MSVVSITSNFQSESRLHEGARMALPHIFDQGWPDPLKISDDSKSAAILLNEAKETFASHLGTRSDELFFLGEPNLGFHLGLSGLLREGMTFKYSGTDRMAAHVIAEDLRSRAISVEEIPVNSSGQSDFSSVGPQDLLSIALANRETGVIAKNLPKDFAALFVDATASGTRVELPTNWSVALWDSKAWMGPNGLGIIGISKSAQWKNPLPHLDNKVSPGPISLPLAITSAIAIDSWVADEKNLATKVSELNLQISTFIKKEISNSQMIPGDLPHLISIIFEEIDSEQLINKLAEQGFAVDAGSACTAANMKPSHVLAAMGLSTTGSIRLTLHHGTSFEEVSRFLPILKNVITGLRN